jgi:MFS family permease
MTRRPASFGAALASSWALLLGFGILMLGDGLQGTLLAVRADLEGFSATLTGLVMSTFYVGFLLGSIMTPRITIRVGHIRVFAAFAALFLGGHFNARVDRNGTGMDRHAPDQRFLFRRFVYRCRKLVERSGRYGQLLLNLASPLDFELFILVSILISVAVVPLLLSAGSPPTFHDSVKISLFELFRLTPLGLVSMFAVGMVTATFFALGPVYAQRIGLNIRDTSYFMTAAVVGTVILQGPIGVLSDRFDRRIVLTLITIFTALSALVCIPAEQLSTEALLLAIGLFGGLAFPLYSVCIAYTNDHLDPNQMIAASGALVLVGGLGAVTGPVLFAALMDIYGNQALFWSIAAVHGLTGLFAVYRMLISAPVPLDKQGPSTATAVHPSGSAIESIQQYTHDETGFDLEDER